MQMRRRADVQLVAPPSVRNSMQLWIYNQCQGRNEAEKAEVGDQANNYPPGFIDQVRLGIKLLCYGWMPPVSNIR